MMRKFNEMEDEWIREVQVCLFVWGNKLYYVAD